MTANTFTLQSSSTTFRSQSQSYPTSNWVPSKLTHSLMVNSTGSQSHLSSQARITIETVENAELDEPPIRKHAYTYLHITRSFTIWTVTLLLFLFNHASVHALTTGSIHSVSSLDHANVFDLQKRQSSNASDNASDDHGSSSQRRIAFDIQALLIPILVILSGVFAGKLSFTFCFS